MVHYIPTTSRLTTEVLPSILHGAAHGALHGCVTYLISLPIAYTTYYLHYRLLTTGPGADRLLPRLHRFRPLLPASNRPRRRGMYNIRLQPQ